jgi:hypothetical protein
MMTAINETQEHKTAGTSEYYKQLQIPSLELGLPVNMPVLSVENVVATLFISGLERRKSWRMGGGGC